MDFVRDPYLQTLRLHSSYKTPYSPSRASSFEAICRRPSSVGYEGSSVGYEGYIPGIYERIHISCMRSLVMIYLVFEGKITDKIRESELGYVRLVQQTFRYQRVAIVLDSHFSKTSSRMEGSCCGSSVMKAQPKSKD